MCSQCAAGSLVNLWQRWGAVEGAQDFWSTKLLIKDGRDQRLSKTFTVCSMTPFLGNAQPAFGIISHLGRQSTMPHHCRELGSMGLPSQIQAFECRMCRRRKKAILRLSTEKARKHHRKRGQGSQPLKKRQHQRKFQVSTPLLLPKLR